MLSLSKLLLQRKSFQSFLKFYWASIIKNKASLDLKKTLFFRQECQYIKCPSHVSYVHTISNVRALNRFLKTMRIVKTNNNKESEEKGKNDHKNRFFLVLLLSYLFFVSYLSLNILLFVIWTSSSSSSYTRRRHLLLLLFFSNCPSTQTFAVLCVLLGFMCNEHIHLQVSLLFSSHSFLFLLLVHNHHHHPPPSHLLI